MRKNINVQSSCQLQRLNQDERPQTSFKKKVIDQNLSNPLNPHNKFTTEYKQNLWSVHLQHNSNKYQINQNQGLKRHSSLKNFKDDKIFQKQFYSDKDQQIYKKQNNQQVRQKKIINFCEIKNNQRSNNLIVVISKNRNLVKNKIQNEKQNYSKESQKEQYRPALVLGNYVKIQNLKFSKKQQCEDQFIDFKQNTQLNQLNKRINRTQVFLNQIQLKKEQVDPVQTQKQKNDQETKNSGIILQKWHKQKSQKDQQQQQREFVIQQEKLIQKQKQELKLLEQQQNKEKNTNIVMKMQQVSKKTKNNNCGTNDYLEVYNQIVKQGLSEQNSIISTNSFENYIDHMNDKNQSQDIDVFQDLQKKKPEEFQQINQEFNDCGMILQNSSYNQIQNANFNSKQNIFF